MKSTKPKQAIIRQQSDGLYSLKFVGTRHSWENLDKATAHGMAYNWEKRGKIDGDDYHAWVNHDRFERYLV